MARRKKKYKVSKAELEVLALLIKHGYEAIPQFRIPGIPFLYDFYLPALNLLIEYNGTYFHADPKTYKAGTLIRMPGFKEKILVDYIWSKDKWKQEVAISFGYKVVVVWENDFKLHGWKAIEKALL